MILLGSPSDFKVLMENYVNMLGLNSKVYHLLKNYIKQRFNVNAEEFSGEKFLKNKLIAFKGKVISLGGTPTMYIDNEKQITMFEK